MPLTKFLFRALAQYCSWRLSTAAILSGLAMLLGASANAQSSFDDFLKQDAETQSLSGVSEEEMRQFESVLNGENADRAISAMRFMVKSGKPRLERRAKEFGLFSSEPLYRQEALKAIFDAGGPFRIEVDLTKHEEKASRMWRYITSIRGGFNADITKGYYIFSVEPYDEAARCWHFYQGDKCAFQLSGTSVSLRGWSDAAGDLTLNQQGVLEGAMRNNWNCSQCIAVPARIELIQQ